MSEESMREAFSKAAAHESKADEIRSRTPDRATPQLKEDFGAAVCAQNELAAATRAQAEQAKREHEPQKRADRLKAEAERQTAESKSKQAVTARRNEEERRQLEKQKDQQRDPDEKRKRRDEEQRKSAAEAFHRVARNLEETRKSNDVKTAENLEKLKRSLRPPSPAPEPPKPSWADEVDKEVADRHQKEISKRIAEHQKSLRDASRKIRRNWNNSR